MSELRGKLDEADLLVTQNLVGGQWIAGSARPIAVDDPFTLDVIAEVAGSSAAEAQAAVDAARDAFPAWAAKTAKERGAVLRRWFELILVHKEDLAEKDTA